MNKKGVSPLIATVLLIAFAVSVGAVIMNWTSSATGIESHGEGDCGITSLNVVEINGQKEICLDRERKKIIITVETGQMQIEGIRISFLGSTNKVIDKNEQIEAGALKTFELSYDPAINGELNKIKLTPFIIPNEKKMYCADSGEIFNTIFDCEK